MDAALQFSEISLPHLFRPFLWVILICECQKVDSFIAVGPDLILQKDSMHDVVNHLHAMATSLNDIGWQIFRSHPQRCAQWLLFRLLQIQPLHVPNRVHQFCAHLSIIEQNGQHCLRDVQLLELIRSIQQLLCNQ